MMMGTMGNEHFNAMVRRGCWGDDSICSIDGSMTRANFRNWLRALLNVLPQVGASRERTKGGHVHMPPFDGAGVPPLAHLVQCVVVMLDRLGIQLAPSVQELLGRYEMMPDFRKWKEQQAFLHELVEFAPPPLLRRHVSTSSQGLVLKCGLNNWKRISSGLDMQRIGKATELKRKRRLPSSDEEDD